MSHDSGSCPVCGAKGKSWRDEPDVFRCPACDSVFSRFGIVAEPRREMRDEWN